MRDKLMTVDDVVAQVKDGMTVGIGGWGSRRKPMALVRGLLRSEVRDLTVVSWGGAYTASQLKAYHQPYMEANSDVKLNSLDYSGGLAEVRAQSEPEAQLARLVVEQAEHGGERQVSDGKLERHARERLTRQRRHDRTGRAARGGDAERWPGRRGACHC